MGFFSALFGTPTLTKGTDASAPSTRTVKRPKSKLPAAEPTLRQSSIGIPYTLERASRKSIGLIIGVNGLIIRAPKWTPLYEIDAAIRERKSWIETAVAKQQARKAQLADFTHGGHILFRGVKLKIDVRPGLFESIDLTETRCVMTTVDGTIDHDRLTAELKRLASLEILPLAEALAIAAGLPMRGAALSAARTTWGTCTADGRVRLNYRLIQLPPHLMRHVIAHELAHLVEFNHSPAFWAIVEQLDQGSKKHRKAIKAYSALLEL